MVFTRAELIEQLMANGFYKPDAVRLTDLFFEEIRLALEQGEEVKLTNLGNFIVRDKKLRLGRNPKTGEEIAIKPRRVVVFRTSQSLKSKVAKLKKPKNKT